MLERLGRSGDEPGKGNPFVKIVGYGLSVRPSSCPLRLTCEAQLRDEGCPRCAMAAAMGAAFINDSENTQKDNNNTQQTIIEKANEKKIEVASKRKEKPRMSEV